MNEKYSIALWSKTTGLALSGATVELRGDSGSFSGDEVLASGRYVWDAIARGRYVLFVNGDSTGETYAVGAGELAGIGYADGKKLASTPTAIEWVADDEGSFVSVQLDTTVTPAVAKGKFSWNEAEGTFNMGLKNGVTLQAGMEGLIPVHNESGRDLINGRAVGLTTGSTDGELHVDYVENATTSAYDTIAVLTQDIANGAYGYVTKWGKVRDIDTAHLTGDAFVYLGASLGQLTSIKPEFPAHVVQIGKCNISNAVNGAVYVDITVDLAMEDLYNVYPSNTTPAEGDTLVREGNRWINRNFGAITRDPTGFKNGGSVVVSYDSTTRKVTLTGPVEAYYRASLVPALITGWVSSAHPAGVTTTQFLYFDGVDFVWSSVPWTYDMLQITAVVYNDLGVFQFGIHETHGTMAWQTHQELHQVIGCYNRGGGDLSSYVLNSTTAANRRPDISTTLLADEDLETLNPLLASKLYTTYSLSGAGTSVSFGTGLADIIALSGNNPYYNLFSGGVWSQALMSNNDYAAIFVYAMPVSSDAVSQGKRYFFVQPQASSSSQTTIDALTSNDVNLGGLTALNPELNAIAKIVIRYTASNWRLISVSKLTGSRYGMISVNGVWLSSVTTDASLSGLGTAAVPLAFSGDVLGQLTLSKIVSPTLTVGANASTNPQMVINGAVANARALVFKTAGSSRWSVSANATAEGGANSGSNLEIRSYADDGTTVLDSPISIARANTGLVAIRRNIQLDTLIYSNTANGGIFGYTNDGADNCAVTLSSTTGQSSSRGGYIVVKGNEVAVNGGDVLIEAGNGTNGDIILRTNNAERMRITKAGEIQFKSAIPGTANKVAKTSATGSSTLVDSSITDDGSAVSTSLPIYANAGVNLNPTQFIQRLESTVVAGFGALAPTTTNNISSVLNDRIPVHRFRGTLDAIWDLTIGAFNAGTFMNWHVFLQNIASKFVIGNGSRNMLIISNDDIISSVPISSAAFVQQQKSTGTSTTPVTLPSPVDGGVFTVFCKNNSTMTVNSFASTQIISNGASAVASITLIAYQGKTFASDGSYWYTT